MNNILIVSPHPDDIAFFLGGTFLQHLRSPDRVTVLLMSDGERGSWLSAISSVARKIAKKRSLEMQNGLDEYSNLSIKKLHIPDGKFSEACNGVNQIEQILGENKFDLIYLPEFQKEKSLYQHPDHLICGEWVFAWAKKTEHKTFRFYHSKAITLRIGIDHEWKDSVRLLRNHKSQYSFFAFPPLLLWIGEVLRFFKTRHEGKKCGHHHAEFFRT